MNITLISTFKCLLLIITSFSGTLMAQYYSFSVENEPYTSISNPEFVVKDSAYLNNNVAVMHQSFKGSTFYAFGALISGIFEAGVNCYTVAQGDNNDFIFDPFLVKLRSDGSSEFRSKYYVIGKDSVLEMEWYNFRIVNHPNSDYINVVARMYTTSEIIEFHYGPSSLSINPPFPGSNKIITLQLTKKGFTPSLESIWLSGDPQNPKLTSGQVGTMSDFPSEGTLYRFVGKKVTTGIDDSTNDLILPKIYPNPAVNELIIDLPVKQIKNIRLIDASGRELAVKFQGDQQTILNVEQIQNGIYWVNVTLNNGGIFNLKFTKN